VEEGAGEWVKQERRERHRDGASEPLLLGQMKAAAETAHDPSHQGKADREEDERASPTPALQQVLSPEAQGEGGEEPDGKASEKESRVN